MAAISIVLLNFEKSTEGHDSSAKGKSCFSLLETAHASAPDQTFVTGTTKTN